MLAAAVVAATAATRAASSIASTLVVLSQPPSSSTSLHFCMIKNTAYIKLHWLWWKRCVMKEKCTKFELHSVVCMQFSLSDDDDDDRRLSANYFKFYSSVCLGVEMCAMLEIRFNFACIRDWHETRHVTMKKRYEEAIKLANIDKNNNNNWERNVSFLIAQWLLTYESLHFCSATFNRLVLNFRRLQKQLDMMIIWM